MIHGETRIYRSNRSWQDMTVAQEVEAAVQANVGLI